MQAVFIDIDNTLLDFDEYVRQTMRNGFAKYGLKPYEPYMYGVFTEVNNGLWHRIEQGTLTFAGLEKIRWNMVFERVGIEFDGDVFEKYFRRELFDSAIPVPGAYALLEGLHGRAVLCAASNGPYEQQLHRLEIAGMRRYFDFVFISERFGVSKPSPDFFDAAFRELNQGRAEPILPGDTVMLGDSLTSDIAGGRQYGMKTCFYRRDPAAPSDAADWVVDDLSLAPGLLLR